MSNNNDVQAAVQALDQDGFVVVRGFFDINDVNEAGKEIEAWLNKDLAQREANGHGEAWFSGEAGNTILTAPTHLMLDAYAKSPVLDRMTEKILTDPFSKAILDKLVGDGIKLRGYNIQKMTGRSDPRPGIGISSNPHEWHRDSLGEIGIAMFLEDVPGPGNGATSLVKGSHYFPYCPRWNSLLGPPYVLRRGGAGSSFFLRRNYFSKRLGAEIVNKRSTGAYGNKGDFYFFINDVWHGREPNIHGRQGIKVMIGAFSVQDAFPDKVSPPPQHILDLLPPALRRAAAQEVPDRLPDISGTILRRMRSARAHSDLSSVFKWARIERRFADACSDLLKFRWPRVEKH